MVTQLSALEHISTPVDSESTNAFEMSDEFEQLPMSSDVPETEPDVASQQYHTMSEIIEEARALIASWESNLRLIDYDPCHSSDQLRTIWAASGIHSITDMPPPTRYRRVLRVPKNAFIG